VPPMKVFDLPLEQCSIYFDPGHSPQPVAFFFGSPLEGSSEFSISPRSSWSPSLLTFFKFDRPVLTPLSVLLVMFFRPFPSSVADSTHVLTPPETLPAGCQESEVLQFQRPSSGPCFLRFLRPPFLLDTQSPFSPLSPWPPTGIVLRFGLYLPYVGTPHDRGWTPPPFFSSAAFYTQIEIVIQDFSRHPPLISDSVYFIPCHRCPSLPPNCSFAKRYTILFFTPRRSHLDPQPSTLSRRPPLCQSHISLFCVVYFLFFFLFFFAAKVLRSTSLFFASGIYGVPSLFQSGTKVNI